LAGIGRVRDVRFVIYGAGAVGGVLGARLHQSGHDVMLIARGAHHDSIARDGLRFYTPTERVTLRLPVAPDPAAARIEPDDVVILATKSQDTWGALLALRAAVPEGGVPVVCMQNGVENERIAQRLFREVYGAVVLAPTAHLEPGLVLAYAAATTGTLDVGRYPNGIDERCVALCEAIERSRFSATPREDIMGLKYAKLLLNLGNAMQAILGAKERAGAAELTARARAEGVEVLEAAGIAVADEGVMDVDSRSRRWQVGDVEGYPRGGGSTWQSLTRHTGAVETDFLNGEIVLEARRLGMPAPINELLQTLTAEMAREGRAPGWLSPADVLERIDGR
jgi:2-dehydropantoate 2-reductase